jgi:hypothetical protein
MDLPAKYRAKHVARALTVAGGNTADVVFLIKANGFFAAAAFAPKVLNGFHELTTPHHLWDVYKC